MKLRLLLVVIVLVASAFLGQLMLDGSGYVLLSYGNWVLETSIWVALAALTISLIAGYFVLHMTIGLLNSGSALQRWSKDRGQNKAVRKTIQGLLALAEGNWKRSEKLLVSSAHGEAGLINYLAAARAAQQSGDYARADELLTAAANSTKGTELAVGLQQAQLQLEREQYEQCLATCLRLRKKFPKHQYANKMLLKAYMALEDWQSVVDLLPQLIKQHLIATKSAKELELKAYTALIQHVIKGRSARSKDPSALIELWNRIPQRTQLRDDFIPLADAFVHHLVELNTDGEAEEHLRRLLTRHWQPKWVRLYGWVKGDSPKKQLLFAEAQLQERPNDAVLLLTLGRLSLRNELWGKAQEYLEASLALKSDHETRAELSRLYLALNQSEKALNMLKLGLGQQLPELPMPAVQTV